MCKVALICKIPNVYPVSDTFIFVAFILRLAQQAGLKEENPQKLFKNSSSGDMYVACFFEVDKRNPSVALFPGSYPSACSV